MTCARARAARRTGVGVGGVAAAILALGCGDSGPSGAAKVAEADSPPVRSAETGARGSNAAPELRMLELQPHYPTPGQRVRAVVRADDPDGDRLQLHTIWRVNGEIVTRDQDAVELRAAEKGDVVAVEAWASDGRAQSLRREERTRVANRPPELWAVAIEGDEEVEPGTRLVASPRAHDPDGDELEFRYEWRVNGEWRNAAGPVFATEGLQRGDEVEVAVVASDGESRSEEKRSQPVTIGNRPPQIVSDASWDEEDGLFRYRVEARDPDGDRTLRYRLLESPPSMEIDPVRGLVSWRPGPDDEGVHDVAIEVDDLHGGRSVQSVQLTIRVEETASSQGADRDRSRAAPGPASYDEP